MLDRISRGPFGSAWRHPLAATIVLGVLTIFFFAINLALCAAPFLAYGLLFAGIWFYRFSRDQRIIAESRTVEQETPMPGMIPLTMTSPGSGRLYVPEPLDRNR